MTTEDDFQAALDADPADWQTRLVFADWLQDRGDPRADGYRALGTCRAAAFKLFTAKGEPQEWIWWNAKHYERQFPTEQTENAIECAMLPDDWFLLTAFHQVQSRNHSTWESRREAEDAAARAFTKLPAARRAELLTPETVSQ